MAWGESVKQWDGKTASGGNGGDFEILPKGRYTVNVDKFTFDTNENGNDFIEFRFRVLEGKFERRIIFHRMFVTPKRMPMLAKEIKAMTGGKITPETNLESIPFGQADPFQVTIGHREYKDKKGVKKLAEDVRYIDPAPPETATKKSADEF